MNDQQTQIFAANTLLEKGVFVDKIKAPFILQLIGRRYIELTLYQSTLAQLVEISQIIASMGLTDVDLKAICLTGKYSLLNGAAQRAMEVMIIAARLKIPLFSRQKLARYMLARISADRFAKAWKFYVAYSGVEDFTDTIILMAEANNLSPMSQRSQTTTG